jgi:maltose alpha-D-glucosyltransferase/alpha-amylase
MSGEGTASRALQRAIEDILPAALARELPRRRWFGDKDRPIDAVVIQDIVLDDHDHHTVGWALVEVTFPEGAPALYTLPFALADEDDPAALAFLPEHRVFLTDGADNQAFAGWWLRLLAKGRDLPTRAGRLAFAPTPGLAAVLERALGAGGRPLGAEQSNSAIRYDDAALIKFFRKAAPGINPDIEIGLQLWEETAFRNIPEPLGVVIWHGPTGAMPVSFAQRWTENEGDGWSWTLRALDGWLGGPGPAASRRSVLDGIRSLGRRTGELHRSLAACAGPDFSPHPVTAREFSRLTAHALENLDLTLQAIRDAGRLDERAAPLAVSALRREDELRARLAGMDALEGTAAIRVHGDYHLGQVLRTPEEDWVILDFEGEPARPADERRLRQPALKDVGGMLRSLAYARGAALDAVASRGAALPPDTLDTWETDARRAFIESYRAAIRAGSPDIVPLSDRSFARALDAWELDKALYEVRYELANRPSWAALPLAALAGPPLR